jgi:hypothetical protein
MNDDNNTIQPKRIMVIVWRWSNSYVQIINGKVLNLPENAFMRDSIDKPHFAEKCKGKAYKELRFNQ